MLLDQNSIDEISQAVSAADFYHPQNGTIFACVCEMRAKNLPVDPVTVSTELERRGQLEEIGGTDRIFQLMATVPHTAHADFYCQAVRDAARRRAVMASCISAARKARDKTIPTDTLLAEAESEIHAVMESTLGDRPVEIGDVLESVLAGLQSGEEATQPAIPTGLDRIDDACSGGLPVGLTVLAARPSQGKTSLAASIAIRSAEAGAKVLFVSYEQTKLEVTQRLLSIYSGVSFRDLGRSNLDDEKCHRIMEAAGRLQKLSILIDTFCRNQSGLATTIRLQARKGTQLVVVDYLQLIECDDRRLPREQQVAALTRQLKTTATSCGVPVLALAQLNREVEKRADQRPRLSDLRESGAIEQDADIVLLLHRPGSYHGDRRDASDRPLPPVPDDFGILHVAKHRNGPTGEVKLVWHPATMKYSADVTDPFAGGGLF